MRYDIDVTDLASNDPEELEELLEECRDVHQSYTESIERFDEIVGELSETVSECEAMQVVANPDQYDRLDEMIIDAKAEMQLAKNKRLELESERESLEEVIGALEAVLS